MPDNAQNRSFGRKSRVSPQTSTMMSPLQVAQIVHASTSSMPDIMEFITSDKYLDRGKILYPRQATLLKTIFLQDSLYTQYDYDVLEEWTTSFARTGDQGIQPDILQRIKICQEQKRPWFREVIAIMGRRGGKGHVGALAGAYVLWNYMHKPGGPQSYYGIDSAKRLTAIVFAGKKEQAKANQWKDLSNIIVESPCFGPYISRPQAESLTVYAPSDVLRAQRRELHGVASEADLASFEIVPRESTLMAGRGPTSFCLDPQTPVLTSNLEWVPIESLVAGDRVVGIDEYSETKGAQRKLRDAEVVAIRRVRKAAIRLTFADDSQVVCSTDHQWLFKSFGKGGSYEWRETSKLTVGSRIRSLVDPWMEDRSWEAGYLAAIFDGEGCLSGYNKRAGQTIYVSQNPGPVLTQTLDLLTARKFNPLPNNDHAYARDGKCEQWALRNTEDAMRFLGQIKPIRLYKKQRRVWEGVAPRGGDQSQSVGYKTIVSIEELPEQDLVDIQTSTHTFIANGLMSHNCQFYDEMAHLVASGANRSAEELWNAATPSLDQFKQDAFIYAGSSPWQMTGQFYTLWKESLERENGRPVYPEKLMLQLPSWAIYEDWAEADRIPRRPPSKTIIQVEVEVATPAGLVTALKDMESLGDLELFAPLRGSIQEYDDSMKQLEKANPETFAVERRSKWAAVLDAYLDYEKVQQAFAPWDGREIIGTDKGMLSIDYYAHGDPAKVNDRFGFAIGHAEPDPATGLNAVVFDVVHYWAATDWEEKMIDYIAVEEDLEVYIKAFNPATVTFDQFNSGSIIAHLNRYAASIAAPKRTDCYEVTATAESNWRKAEAFKTALNMGLVHVPKVGLRGKPLRASETAELELRFLQRTNKRVDHPSSGPVQSKDVADCLIEITWALIGEQVTSYLAEEFTKATMGGTVAGGMDPYRQPGEGSAAASDDAVISLLSSTMSAGRRQGLPGGYGAISPSRGTRPR